MAILLSVTVFLMVSAFVPNVTPQETSDYDYELNETPQLLPYIPNKEYFKKMNSIIDAYRGDKAGRTVIETNALVNTKYRTWKRNADLINSLLALPKGMNDAGRR